MISGKNPTTFDLKARIENAVWLEWVPVNRVLLAQIRMVYNMLQIYIVNICRYKNILRKNFIFSVWYISIFFRLWSRKMILEQGVKWKFLQVSRKCSQSIVICPFIFLCAGNWDPSINVSKYICSAKWNKCLIWSFLKHLLHMLHDRNFYIYIYMLTLPLPCKMFTIYRTPSVTNQLKYIRISCALVNY